MPPRKQITEDMIIETAYRMVREKGLESLSVRNLAIELNCSTQPIYVSFRDMGTLKNALGQKAMTQMQEFVLQNQKEIEDGILATILGYVQFAYEERNLYQLMYSSGVMTMNQTGKMVAESNLLGMNMMIYANGLIMMNSFGTIHLSWEQTKEMLIQAYRSFEKSE